jgi:flagellar protein FliO/FliZ
VLGTTVIGPQQRLLSVEVGEGEHRRWLLLGVTPQQVTHLLTSEVPLQAAPPEPDPAAFRPEPFHNVLARWRPDAS